MEPRPTEAVVAVIVRAGRVVFVRRAPHKPGGGMWCPVSGRVERDESQPAAVAREVLEELGVAAVAVRHVGSVLTSDGAFRLHYWRTEIHGEPHLANDEATALRWLDAHDLRALHPTFPEDVAICERELRAPGEEGEAVTHDREAADRRDPEGVLARLLAPDVRGVVGVLRSASAAHALSIADAAAEAGLSCIEITWTTPGAADVVRSLRERRPHLLVGAGSIFDEAQAHEAWEAGAAFLVSPHLAHGVSDVCRSLGALYVPGAATASEVVAATERGHPLVKLFPIAQLGGAEFVRALRGPIPGLKAMVTGGVGPDEVAGYLAAGAALVGLGSVFGHDVAETRRRVARLSQA